MANIFRKGSKMAVISLMSGFFKGQEPLRGFHVCDLAKKKSVYLDFSNDFHTNVTHLHKVIVKINHQCEKTFM